MDAKEEQVDWLGETKCRTREMRDRIVATVARMEGITLQRPPQIRADCVLEIGCRGKARFATPRMGLPV
jgi:hypothetical protein